MTNIADLYNDPPLIHPWELIDGQPKCELAGVALSAPEATATLQRNAAVRDMIGAVEAYEAAQAIVARGEPDNGQPKEIPDPAWVDPQDGSAAPLIANPAWALLPRTVTTTGVDGQDETAPEPRWQDYDVAVALIAAASDATKALALWRAGEPDAGDATAHDAWSAAKATALAALASEAAKPLENDPRPVPSFVTLFQGRTVMRQMPGTAPFAKLFDAVDAYVEAHKADNHALYDAWNFSNGFDRHGALVNSLAPAFGITDPQLDLMFRMGAAIKA